MAVSGRYRGLKVRRSIWFIEVQVTFRIEREASLAARLSQQGSEPCRMAELTGSGWIINKGVCLLGDYKMELRLRIATKLLPKYLG